MSEKLLIVNKLSGILTVQRGFDKFRFLYNEPVEVDYSEDGTIIGYLLRNPELHVCNKKMLEVINSRKKVVAGDPTLVEQVAEQKKVEKEKKEKKVAKEAARKEENDKKENKQTERNSSDKPAKRGRPKKKKVVEVDDSEEIS